MRKRTKIRTRGLVALPASLTAAAAGPAAAHWAHPDAVPVERLVANLTGRVERHPDDAQGHYLLGRVHGLAFILEARTISVWPGRGTAGDPGIADDPAISDDSFQPGDSRGWARVLGGRDAPPPEGDVRLGHLCAAVRHLERSIELRPESPLAWLGLAYVLDRGRVLADSAECVPGGATPATEATRAEVLERIGRIADGSPSERQQAIAELQEAGAAWISAVHGQRHHASAVVRDAVRRLLEAWWQEWAIAAYLAAYDGAIGSDIKIDTKPLRGLATLASYEAAHGFLRLVKARGIADDRERDHVARVERGLQALDDKPDNMIITPIILSLERAAPLRDLLDPGTIVAFDLDGDRAVERWPWVRPDTAILVWDPRGEGRITSGRQLFGTATWWMFFADGYKALAALDDDGDGWLAGPELAGLAVWHDRDGDGVSDPGEVTPVARAGIEALAAAAAGTVEGVPAHPGGARLRDGRALPTWDWIVAPCEEQDPAPEPNGPR